MCNSIAERVEIVFAAHREDFLRFVAGNSWRLFQLAAEIDEGKLIDWTSGTGRLDADALVGHYVDGTAACLSEALQVNLGLSDEDLGDLSVRCLSHARDLVDMACEVHQQKPLFGLVGLALWQEGMPLADARQRCH